MIKIGQLVLENNNFKFINVFLLFRYYLPLEKNVALHSNKFDSPTPKDALCEVCFKSDWERGEITGGNQIQQGKEFSSSKSHSTLWHKLIKILSDNNVIVSCKKAQDKWKKLKKKYKEVEVEDTNN